MLYIRNEYSEYWKQTFSIYQPPEWDMQHIQFNLFKKHQITTTFASSFILS